MPPVLYLDYIGNGMWALAYDKAMSFPRYEVCANPLRLVQDYGDNNIVIMSEAAEIVLGDYQNSPHWADQYFIIEKYNHPDCKD